MKAVGWEAEGGRMGGGGGSKEFHRRRREHHTQAMTEEERHMGTAVIEIPNSKKCAVSRLRIKRRFLFK